MKAAAVALLLLLAGSAGAQAYSVPSAQDLGASAANAAMNATDAAASVAQGAARAVQERVPGLQPQSEQERRISLGISPPSNLTLYRDRFDLSVTPGQSVIMAKGFPVESGVQSVTLNVVPGSGQETVQITVERRGNENPPVAAVPPGAVHSYIEVTPNASTAGGTVRVRVDCVWLGQLGVQGATARLTGYHLGPGGWEALPTTVNQDPSGCILVSFDTPSFSWFAVSEAPQNTVPGTGFAVPKPSPGFEAVFAVAGLLAVAYLVNRRER